MTPYSQVVYLQHARDALRSVIEYTKDGQSAFAASKMVQDAVLRNLEVLGEAVKAISAETRSLASDVQWRRITGMRDVLIHQYFGVDLDVVSRGEGGPRRATPPRRLLSWRSRRERSPETRRHTLTSRLSLASVNAPPTRHATFRPALRSFQLSPTGATPASLATGGEFCPLSQHLWPLFSTATDIAILAAFVTETGLALLERWVFKVLRA